MAIKCTFKKHAFDYPMHECFFCRGKPTGILTFIHTGEEVRCCEKCFLKRRKGNRAHKRQKAKKISNSLIENRQNGFSATPEVQP